MTFACVHTQSHGPDTQARRIRRDRAMGMCQKLLLTVIEAAQRLGFGRSMTYQLIQKGALPSIKIGGARRVAVADLEEFVGRLRSEAGEEAT